MIDPELVARIRRLFYAEHWKIGTIADQLDLHHDTVRRAIGSDRFTPTRRSSVRRWSSIPDCERLASSR